MADTPETNGGVKLPPKLNLRDKGILKGEAQPAARPQQPEPPAAPATAPQEPLIVAKPLTFTPKLSTTTPAPETKQAEVPAPVEQPAAAKHETSRIPLEAAAPVVAAEAEAQPRRPMLKKSETSRIPLNAAVASAGEDKPRPAAPKTIRIKPAMAPTGLRAAPPIGNVAPVASDAARGVAEPLAAKSKTSRISLEAALAPETKQAERVVPATVKLKPPSEAPTVKVAQAPAPQAAEAPKTAMSKTSRLDDLSEAEPADESPTQKKTIRVKRPDQTGGVKAPAVARVGGPVPLGAASQKTGTVGWAVFSVLAIAAMLIACTLVYVLAVQAVPSLGLSWPGKISAL